MHRTIRNALQLEIRLTPITPLAIASGENGLFVRYLHPRENVPTAYVPGTTLKGALRRAAEQIVQAAGLDCCSQAEPCSARESVRTAADGATLYRALCSVCRIFGSRAFGSLLSLTDAYPIEPINELSLHELPTDSYEAVMNESFYGTLSLRNFERWQIGLISLIAVHLNSGQVTLGAGHSAGMGRVQVAYEAAAISYFGAPNVINDDPLYDRLHGVGQFLGAANPYGCRYPDRSDTPDLPTEFEYDAQFGQLDLFFGGGVSVHELIDRQIAAWQDRVRAAL